jgi:hypothetical protein
MPTRYLTPTSVTFTFSTYSGQAISYFRFRPDLASDETLVSATFETTDEQTHTAAYTAQRVADNGKPLRDWNWNNDPAVLAGSTAVAGTRTGKLTQFDVTADALPGIVFTLRVTSADTATRWINGPRDASGYPRLVIVTEVGTVAPNDVRPNGIISDGTPIVQWTEQDGIDKAQIQAAAAGAAWDETAGFTAPTWSSGDIITTDGSVDTGTAGWGGIANTASADITVRQHTGSGWGPWSAPITVTRQNKPTVTITNPTGATSEDSTPPIQWSVTGGTQTAWQVDLYRNGIWVTGSGKRSGTDTLWTPPSWATTTGDTMTANLYVWDSFNRASDAAGDPTWTPATKTVTYARTASVTPVTTSSYAMHPSGAPIIDISWTRGAGLPDAIAVDRDGVELTDRIEPAESTWTEWSIPPNTTVDYKLFAVVNNQTASTSPATLSIRLEVEGLWIIDPITERGFRVRGDQLQLAYGEVNGLYTPITAEALVSRLSALRGVEGSMVGLIDDWPGRTREQQVADVWFLRANPREVRLIVGDLNVPVTLRNLYTIFDTELSRTDNIEKLVRFDIQQAGRELPWQV